MDPELLAKSVVDRMYDKDYFSQWLGIERIKDGPGISILKMKIRPDMCNGFGIVHGGITYSFADSALAFASNSHGRKSVSIETSISHLVSLYDGEVITATTKEKHRNHKIAVYQVEVHKQDGTLAALFNGTVYRTSKDWFE